VKRLGDAIFRNATCISMDEMSMQMRVYIGNYRGTETERGSEMFKSLRANEEFGSKTLSIHFCVFEKNAVKVWNLLGNALEKFLILAHKIG
jgi:hypothetical protein